MILLNSDQTCARLQRNGLARLKKEPFWLKFILIFFVFVFVTNFLNIFLNIFCF